MEEEIVNPNPSVGPNPADSSETPAEGVNVFGYNVAAQVGSPTPKPNPNSPLAAG